MAKRKNFIQIDGSAFADYADRLDRLGADLQKVFGDALLEAGEVVQADVKSALSPGNLPAHGRYSTGETLASVMEPKVTWHGSLGEIPLGFDKTKKGAGGWLITGTPKMSPDHELARIFTTRSYENKIKKQIEADLEAAIQDIMGG